MNEIVVLPKPSLGFFNFGNYPILAITQFWQLPDFGNYPILAI